VAHPQFRAELLAQAQALGYVGASQTLRNLHAYAVEEERQITVKDGRQLLLRPSASNDADGIRALFHGLSGRDVYTRFFRKVRGLSDQDVQRLCNLNFDNEVAFVAAAGPREQPQIVAQSCYFGDPGTNLAEIAFMVHPQWQGTGLGSRIVARHRKELRLRDQRHAQVARVAHQFDQPVGLPLRRALAERQPARHREHGAEIDRPHPHRGTGRFGDGGEARVAQIRPRALRREVVVDGAAQSVSSMM
jgi:GNAT superfamily N-acetyltransferase